jgi:hypothetical protein
MSPEEKAKADEIYKAIIGKERNTLVKRYGKDAEKVAKGRAIKQAQKLAEKKMDSSKDRLKEMVKSALMGTMNEKMDPVGHEDADIDNDGDTDKTDKYLANRRAAISKAKGGINEMLASIIGQAKTYAERKYPQLTDQDIKDFIKMHGQDIMDGSDLEAEFDNYVYQNFDLEEDLDLGHTDNEPHMLKGDLYRIGKYAMELYQMVDQFEGMGEVDFPHWWQSKIIKAKEMISSAKHYLDFETREPEIDAMVDVAAAEDIIPNVPTEPLADEVGETLAQRIAKKLKEDVVKGSNIRKDSKGKWRVLSGKTGKMWPQTYDSKADAEDALQAYHATKG